MWVLDRLSGKHLCPLTYFASIMAVFLITYQELGVARKLETD